jgi:hypothetical protein
MPQNFLQIQKEYLQKVWEHEPKELEEFLPAYFKEGCFHFQAFGEPCELYPQEIILGGQLLTGPEGILIALYALHAQKKVPHLYPLKSFKQFPVRQSGWGRGRSTPLRKAVDQNVCRSLMGFRSFVSLREPVKAAPCPSVAAIFGVEAGWG